MGALNVSVCFTRWGHLPHPAFRLLVGMALTALDQTGRDGRPPRVYFAGEEGLVEIMARPRRSVYDALAVLREAGAIEVLEKGRHKHRASYRLNLGPVDDAAGPETKGAESRTRKGAGFRDEGCEIPHVKGVESRTPRNHGGEHEESREGRTSPTRTTSRAAVDDSREYEKASAALIRRHGPQVHELIARHRAEHPEQDAKAAVIDLASRRQS